jgi:RNA polymerase sigma-70 factor (TIGR02960 family)
VNAELTEEFTERAGVFRRELLAFCYRMLGSAEEAEEVVQETYLSAWRSYDTFEGRSSLRTWLYRIASRACLKALDSAKRRPLPSGIAGPSADPDGEVARSSEATWLQPFPSDPASIVETRATMRLALVAAFQHLPPRQRAVLILRDVLQWRAGEVAGLLDMSTTAVNSALQRARAQLPVVPDDVAEPPEPERRALLDRYVTAFETADVNGLAVALAEDVSWEMPPIPHLVRRPRHRHRFPRRPATHDRRPGGHPRHCERPAGLRVLRPRRRGRLPPARAARAHPHQSRHLPDRLLPGPQALPTVQPATRGQRLAVCRSHAA